MKHVTTRCLALPLLLAVAVRGEPLDVALRYTNEGAQTVSVAGEFNGWNTGATPLARGVDRVWTTTLHLEPGDYAYKFVVDGNWLLDPGNPQRKTTDGVENSLLAVPLPAPPPVDLTQPRLWTAASGATLEARLVEVRDAAVVLARADGKTVRIALAALAESDRALVASQAPAPAAGGDAKGAWPRGVIARHPLTARMYDRPSKYFSGGPRQAAEKFYGKYVIIGRPSSDADHEPRKVLGYDPAQEAAFLYVPESYDGSTNWGVLIHVDPGDGSTIRDDWKPVMASHQLIFGCAWGAENGKPDLRRIGLALDTLATIRKEYPVNPRRVVISGLSGGGLIAVQTALLYPEFFAGAISHAAQAVIRPDANGGSHFPYLGDSDLDKVAREPIRWAFITGENDKNYKTILNQAQAWEDGKFDARFFDVPGMGHEMASGERLDLILRWMEGREAAGAEPRFKENGMSFRERRVIAHGKRAWTLAPPAKATP